MPTPSEYLKRASVIIITGGSSGIGAALIKATQKVRPDVLICNLSRSQPDTFLGENLRHFGTDLSDPAQLAEVAAELIAVVGAAPEGEVVLINNSGFGDYGPVGQLQYSKQLMMIDLNVRAVVDLTMRLLPMLEERGGAVVSVASTAAFQPTPYMATYGATKAFVLSWMLALSEDLKGTKVRALAVCPGPTRSNFFKAAGFSTPPMQGGGLNAHLDMTAEEVAEQTLQALAKGRALVVTGWKNRWIALLGAHLPKVLGVRLTAGVLRKMRLEAHQGGN